MEVHLSAMRTTYLHFAYILHLLFLTSTAQAQNSYPDSLQIALRQSRQDGEKAEICNRLSFHFLNQNLDSSLSYAVRASELAKRSGNDTILARSYICRSFTLESMGEPDEAIASLDSALVTAEKLNIDAMLYSAYSNQAKLKRQKHQYADALTLYLKALQAAERMKDEDKIAKAYSHLGVFYVSRHDLEKGEESHLKALEYFLKNGPATEISTCYENLGIVCREKKEYTRALEYYKKALDINIAENDSSSMAYSYNDLGAAYSFTGQFDLAEKYLLESIAIRTRLKEFDEMAYTLNYLGENYERKGQLELAEHYLKKALQTATEQGLSKQHKESLQSISDYYSRHGRYDSAFHYTRLYQAYADSLQQKDNEEIIAKLSARFENVKKERIIEQQHYQLQRRNYYIAGLLLLLGTAFAAAWTLYQRNRQRQEKKLQEAIMVQQDLATKAVLDAEENERRRIAADLHDGIGQLLTAARLNMESLSDRINLNGENDRDTYRKALLLVDESCREVRAVSHSIMPNALIKSGLGNAIKDFVEKIENKQLTINLQTVGLQEPLDPKVEVVVYRIIQESVNNVIKHSKANQLDLAIIKDADGLQVSIEDNGIGFNKADMDKKDGIGMKNIRARVEFLKGTLDIDTRPGKGTLIAFFIPLQN